jgi:CheY-like chemotaxis protein
MPQFLDYRAGEVLVFRETEPDEILQKGANPPVSKRKLLLADDSVTIQKVVNLTFAEEGIEVITAGDGDTALNLINEHRPNVILADVNMPGANGYQVCEAIRANDTTRDTPVVLLVGSFEPFDEVEANRVGANAFLTKPFQSIRQLVAQVNELIGPEPELEQGVSEQVSANGDDIDHLYHQSISGPAAGQTTEAAEPDAAPAGESEFSDQGLDDEMIETAYGESIHGESTIDFDPVDELALEHPQTDSAVGDAEFGAEPAGPAETAEYGEVSAEQADRPEETFGGAERHDWEPASFSAETGYQDPSSQPGSYEQETAESQHQIPTEEFMVSSAGVEMPEAEAGPIGEETVRFEQPLEHQLAAEQPSYERREEEVQPQLETYGQAPEVEPQQVTYGQAAEEPILERPVSPAPAEAPRFDDIELLELPPIGENRTVELTTAERAELMGSDKRVVSLSPELMDEIVRQVVEKLSSKY